MHARPLVIAVTIVAGAFLLVGPPAGVDPIGPPSALGPIDPPSFVDLPAGGFWVHAPRELASPFPDARPCLIDTVSCLELSPEPFAPCLLAVERCSGTWQLHPLVGRSAH